MGKLIFSVIALVGIFQLVPFGKMGVDEIYFLANDTIKKHGFNCKPELMTRIALVESGGDPLAIGDGGKAIGLMQMWENTSKDLYNRLDYNYYRYEEENLKRPEVAMYFACAYFDWIAGVASHRGEDWAIRAYNGGYGWEGTEERRRNTAIYLNKVKEVL